MTLRNATRSLAPALRRLAYRQARVVSPRQFSASAHSAPKGSDTTWIVRLRHPFSFVFGPQLVLVDRVRARLYPDGQSSNVSLSECIYKLRPRLDICCRLPRGLNQIMRTALLVMDSPVLLRRTPRQRHLQSRSRYATSPR
jgi:hypothetical protein